MDGLLEDLQQVVDELTKADSEGDTEGVISLAEELRAIATTIERANK